MIKAGVIGGAGYTAGELLRILIHHPDTELVSVMSSSHTGEPVCNAHPDLEGDTELTFTGDMSMDAEVVFLCSGHGKSKVIVESDLIPENAKIIDLSSDYRLKEDHDFVYGLPELNRKSIKEAVHIANPGCFATCIQLSLLPLADAQILNSDVHVTAITGSTGAGQNPSATTHFSWRSNNASVYKVFSHQHLAEIRQSLLQLQGAFSKDIHFVPIRGAFTRGILAVSYLKCDHTENELKALYNAYYATHPFVHLTDTEPDVKRVVNSNKALLHVKKMGEQAVITGVIDNLTKGASGQAIQNMNLMFGLNESAGLNLKTTGF